jgi:hypothetical protein
MRSTTHRFRPLLATLVAACALLSFGAGPASAWTDINDEQVVATSGSLKTWQFSAWIQPFSWSNPRGGDLNTWQMNYIYAYKNSGGNANVCVDAHLDSMDGPTVGGVCGTNGASTTATNNYDYRTKYVFANNNSSAARTMVGGWQACAFLTGPC